MTIALDLRGLRKSFVAGTGNCRATAHVLRGLDLVARTGEITFIVGATGSGKSTLMLCAAALLTPDMGERRWFGETARAVATKRVLYHTNTTDLLRGGTLGESHVHLVDLPNAIDSGGAMESWMRQRAERGDAVIVSCRDELAARRLGARALVLRAGQLQPLAPLQSRVAEFVDRSFQRV
jgi:energy-coupling factor transporter ATP-binding protein EcfA2